MPAGLSRPDVWLGLALNADPNDPLAVPVWTPWQVTRVSNLERGRNHELDVSMSSDPSIDLPDPDEYLNPDNSASPYAGLIEPYRSVCMVCQWPASPAAGQVNLINANTWRGNKVDPFDPTFQSYALGLRAPNWITSVNVDSPVIENSNPFEGTRHVRYNVSAVSGYQGVSWPVACIPGRQYTASGYVKQTAANFQRFDITDQSLAAETFTAAATGGWGTSYFGGTWVALNGLTADYAKGNGRGIVRVPTPSNTHQMVLTGVSARDALTVTEFSVDSISSGASLIEGLSLRHSTTGDYYVGEATLETDGTISAGIRLRSGGVFTTVVAPTATGLTYAPNERIRMAFSGTDSTFNLYIWKPTTGAGLPAVPTVTGSSNTISAPSGVGLVAVSNAGNTNAPTLTHYGFWASGKVAGTATSAVGSYNRLSVTFTATQPIHTVQLYTATGLAGTVYLDAIQHEQGGSPSTFTSLGPVIYPQMRHSVEQWPREWTAQGFRGYVRDAPCVDGLASLQAIAIRPEYVQAVLDLAPDHYWRLNDGAETGLFADTAGGAPLLRLASKYGAGTDIEPGTQVVIPGVPGGAGVLFSATTGGSLGNRPGTALTLATPQPFPPIQPPPSAWALSFACWVQLTPNPTGDYQTIIDISSGPPQYSLAPIPLAVRASSTQVDLNLGFVPIAVNILDGQPHHIAAVINQTAAASTRLTLWVDDVSNTTTLSTSIVAGLPVASTLVIGARNDGIPFGFAANGIITEVALWNRILTSSDVSGLYSAGQFAFNGETAGGRILRRLTGVSRYNGPTRITQGFSQPQTNMGAPTWGDTRSLLTDCQETTGAEQGTFWVAPDGAIVFESRQDRWLRTTPRWTIGEDAASGEIPYLLEGLRFVPDPLYVYADVQIGRNNGTTAQGGLAQDAAITARRYFPRSISGQFDLYDDDTAQAMADYLFYSHRIPLTRVSAVVIDPASNPALWHFALSVEIGHRIRFNRRMKAANGGAGFTMSIDFFVEKVGSPTIDFDSGEWKVVLELSPIGDAGQSTPMQPWILGDSTWGVLDSTTVLGW